MKSDEEFHEYAHEHPDAMVALILGAPPPGPYRGTTMGLKRTVRELDLALLPRGPDGDAYLVEVLGYPDPGVERGLFEKAVLAANQHRLWGRLRPVVIYLERRFVENVLPPVLAPGIDLGPIRIVLDEMRPSELLRRSPELFPLLPLSRVSWPNFTRHVGRWWRWTTRSVESSTRRKDLQDRLLQFCAARRPDAILDEIQSALEGIMRFRDTRAGRDILEIGREEGREEGREAARRAIAEAVLESLVTRFGVVPDDLKVAVEAVQDLARLRILLRGALSAADLQSFAEDWLRRGA